MEYSKFQSSLVRYRIAPYEDHECAGCTIGKGVFEDGLHVIVRMAYPRCQDTMLRYYHTIKGRMQKTARHFCWHNIRKCFRHASGLIKLGGANISPYWRHLCYWELFFGYTPYHKVEVLRPEVETWLTKFLRLGGLLPEALYLEMLFSEVLGFMREEWRIPPEWMGLEEWARSGKWMEGKAGTGKKMDIIVGDRRCRTRRMKPLEGVFHSDIGIVGELKLPCREEMYTIQKSESGKIRPVVKTGNCLNRKMNYLSEVVERGLYGSKKSTLFAGERGNEEIDLDLINAVRDGSDWVVPLDQGAFDQHQSKKSIMVVIAAVFVHILPLLNNPEVSDVAAALWDSLSCEGASVYIGREFVGEWINGLPSGWRWTALLDTLLNIGSFRVVCALVKESGLPRPSIRHHYAQGDDIIFTCPDLQSIQRIMELYTMLGYEVNPGKTYISRHRGEFLRRSYEPWGITGYAARTVTGLRFRNPIQENPLIRQERVYPRLVQWHLASLRGAHPGVVADMFLEDVKQAGVDPMSAADYAVTPSSVGGGGVDPASAFGVALTGRGRGDWVGVFSERKLLPVQANLGIWDRRLEELEVEVKYGSRLAMVHDLVASWGIREKDRVGWARGEFRTIPRIQPREPTTIGRLPSEDDMWDLSMVPIQIRGHVKRSAIQQGRLDPYLRPGWGDWVRRLYRRVSTRVADGILTGTFNIPCVLSDNVGVRYGLDLKDRAWGLLGGVLMSRGAGLERVERSLLWIELWLRKEYRRLGSTLVLAQ